MKTIMPSGGRTFQLYQLWLVSYSSQVHEELAVLGDGVLQLLHGAGHRALVPEGGPGMAQPRLQTPKVLLQLPPVLAENERREMLVILNTVSKQHCCQFYCLIYAIGSIRSRSFCQVNTFPLMSGKIDMSSTLV